MLEVGYYFLKVHTPAILGHLFLWILLGRLTSGSPLVSITLRSILSLKNQTNLAGLEYFLSLTSCTSILISYVLVCSSFFREQLSVGYAQVFVQGTSLDVIPTYYLYDKFWKWYRGFPQIWGWVKCSRLLWTIIHCFLTFWISLSSECPVPQSRDKGLSKKVDRVVAQMESTVKEMTLKWPRT